MTDEIKAIPVNGVRTVTGGLSGTTYVVSTAVHTSAILDFCNGCDATTVHTMVTVADIT